MKYAILTEVHYRHSYFPQSGFEGIKVSVPATTTKCLLQQGLLLKPLRDGFLLLYEATFAGSDRSREALLTEPFTLVFDLTLNDALFYNYTQADQIAPADSLFCFSNETGAAQGLLHKGAAAGAQDLQRLADLPERFFTKPFGRITLQVDKNLQSSYEIRFQARTAHWCYFLMSDWLRNLSRPAVISASGPGYFQPAVQLSLPGNGLAPVFISVQPIPLVQANAPTFQLVDYSATDEDRYRVIIPALPGPDISRISNAGAALYKNRNDYSEIFLY